MFLKALEIQGFKSFPDRTRITIERGITAVVGPNGSGKSNISDAIRWVLGETSAKQLRGGGKMENVIFGGTQQRGAMGADFIITMGEACNRTLPFNASCSNDCIVSNCGTRHLLTFEGDFCIIF